MKLNGKCISVRDIMKQHRIHLTKQQHQYLIMKRFADILISLLALIILFIPMLIVAILQKVSSPSEPIFFRQMRVGQNGHIFFIIKFRTMKSSAPKYSSTGDLQDAEKYISKLGRFLRDTSVDELPQLFNVIKGDMSLIGPRPLIRHERDINFMRKFYGVDQLKPGITGWAQVNGRDMLDDCQKVFFDREYLHNIGFAMDIKVFWLSVMKVLGRADIQEGRALSKQ